MARRKGSPLPQEEIEEEAIVEGVAEGKPSVKGFNFVDERITNGQWVNEPHADVVQKFLKLLAICHTAIPEIDEETGRISYEAESPDEAAFVIAARELGFKFYERTQTSILLHELDLVSGTKVERSYQLLNIIEFNSSRKRMSVIVRNEEGKLLLLCKGADSLQEKVPNVISLRSPSYLLIHMPELHRVCWSLSRNGFSILLFVDFPKSQAVMSSDIAIAQFRYLERLLLVHGHWCYRRISSMICYFFYKNIAFGFTLFFYEAYASFSGQPAYNDWFLSLYNVFFTSLPVIALGVFDQDVSARFCLKVGLMFRCIFLSNISVIIFFFCIRAMEHQAFRKGGEVVGLEILGATMYTCVVWVVNCQMALSINYFTYIQHLFIWGGIVFWYIFLMVYGAMDPYLSTTAYKVFVEACAPAPSYWLITLLVLLSSLIPYFVYSAIQMRFFPLYHQMIHWLRNDGQTEDPEYCNMVRQRSLRPTTVGFTARYVARSKRLKDKKHQGS
ncbi:hypothetical protein POTOM_041915 [Populus tomentosa]|uniref:P-type ATPase C-terminal domain-containing protein n=1 Tax=Populus tomentosa TaxID=118781 RepID=A0A8X7YII8_POPTO|nr:hypothetical protein POTOM_041915 [Populus tomentosa]